MGCIITKKNRIISVGYNGCPKTLKNCFQGGCDRCNNDAPKGVDLDKCYCLHAEESAVLECGVANTQGATLYVTLFPCLMCAKIIVHSVRLAEQGISKVYYSEDYAEESSQRSRNVLDDCKVHYEKVNWDKLNVSGADLDHLKLSEPASTSAGSLNNYLFEQSTAWPKSR